MDFTADLGLTFTPTSKTYRLKYLRNSNPDALPCWLQAHTDGFTCLKITRLTIIHLSLDLISVAGRTIFQCPSSLSGMRTPPNPPTVSNDAVEVRLRTRGSPSGKQTHIPLELAKAHHKNLDRLGFHARPLCEHLDYR